jgi:hypothetical protein
VCSSDLDSADLEIEVLHGFHGQSVVVDGSKFVSKRMGSDPFCY